METTTDTSKLTQPTSTDKQRAYLGSLAGNVVAACHEHGITDRWGQTVKTSRDLRKVTLADASRLIDILKGA